MVPHTEHGVSDVIVNVTDNIHIRRYRLSDAPSLSFNANNEKMLYNMTDLIPFPYTEQVATSWITHCAVEASWPRSGPVDEATGKASGPQIANHYAVVVDGQAGGSIGIEFGTDIHRRSGVVGYWLGEQFWGKGVMSLVVPAFVRWCWTTFPILLRLDALTFARNVASGKILEKAGFEYEGRKRNSYIKHGEVGDELTWGALRPET